MSWVPRIGAVFGGYRLEGLVGHGGMSIVYRAEHLGLGRTVALKLLEPHLSEDASFRERFTRESRLAAALDHPNIIPIFEAGEEDGVFYIAMRYVDGSDLKTLINREGPLAPQRAASIVSQVASALGAAHAKELLHRDIKPANILVASGIGPDESDHVYLSDFGVAKQTDARGVTKTGVFVGTADYASPEQIEGKPLDGRTDIYSLGCVLFECLSGGPVFDKTSDVALMYAHLLEAPPSLTEVRPDLPPEVDAVVAKAMAKSPEDRYATTKELAAAVRSALSPGQTQVADRETALAAAPSSATTASPPAVPAAAEPAGRPRLRPDRRLAAVIVVVALAVLGAALAVVLVTRDGGESSASPAAATATEGAMTETEGAMSTTAEGSTTSSHEMTSESEGGLLAMLPSDVPKDSCKDAASSRSGGLEAVSCDFTNKRGDRILLNAGSFRSKKVLDTAYSEDGVAAVKAAGGSADPTNTGACSGTTWLGEGTWGHSGATTAGRRACHIAEGTDKVCKPAGASQCSVIVWTVDASKLLVRATLPSAAHHDLFTWWRFHAHLFG